MAVEPLQPSLAHQGLLTTMHSLNVTFGTWTTLGVILATVLAHRIWNQHKFKLPPLINPRKAFDVTGTAVKKEFVQRSNELIEEGSKAFGEKPYCVMSDMGSIIMLAPKHVDEIRNDPKLSFVKNTEHVSKSIYKAEKILTGNNIGLPCLPAWFQTIWWRSCHLNSRHGC